MSMHAHIVIVPTSAVSRMKLLQLTDLHVSSVPDHSLLDTRDRLERCIRSIRSYHADADLCIITGDLADDGSAQSYGLLKEMLSELAVPVRLTIGNHDIRRNFQESFPDNPRDENGFTQFVIDMGDTRIIVLDTLAEGKIYGWLCDKRMRWLDRELGNAGGRDVYIFMHHPAFPIGLRHHQKIGLVQSQEFIRVCTRHGNVRRIFAGHVHAETNVRSGNLYMSICRGVSQHLLFDQLNANATYIAHAPAYNVILADEHGEAIHFYDLMHESGVVGTSMLPPELEWTGELA
ncbi:MAG: phosphodiesterase [Rhizobiaceae bacterium]|nr:MAG: phosphodiesterase [Rhizobiaceae bacterium]